MSHISDVRQGDMLSQKACWKATNFQRKFVVCNEFMQTHLVVKNFEVFIHQSSSDSKCRCVINQRLMALYEVLKVQTFMA